MEKQQLNQKSDSMVGGGEKPPKGFLLFAGCRENNLRQPEGVAASIFYYTQLHGRRQPQTAFLFPLFLLVWLVGWLV